MRYIGLIFILAAAAWAQSLSIVSGQGQLIEQREFRFYDRLVVKATGSGGLPMSGVLVNWSVTGNAQATFQDTGATTAQSTTDASGIASIQILQAPLDILFATPYAQSAIVARTVSSSVTFYATTGFGDRFTGLSFVQPLLLTPIQTYIGASGTYSATPVSISVLGNDGRGVPNVAFTVLQGDPATGPAVSCLRGSNLDQPGTILTDASGTANCTLAFAGQPGSDFFFGWIGAKWRYIPAGGMNYQVTQATSCTYSLDSASASIGSAGGSLTPKVTASQIACGWTAQSSVAWISVPSGGTGTSVASVIVSPNTGLARAGSVTIAGQTYTVNQAGASGCTYSIAPTGATPGVNGGPASLSITTPAGCPWTASANVNWITLGATSGAGSYILPYNVNANPGAARSATITVAGLSFNLNQAAGASGGPSVLDLAPYSGSGTNITFSATFTHPLGATAIDRAWLLVNTGIGSAGACYIAVNRGGNSFQLISDDGRATLGPVTFGANTALSNSQCSVAAISSSLNATGNVLTVNLALTFTPAFAGRKNVYTSVIDFSNNADDWQALGAWWTTPTTGTLVPRYRLYDPASRSHHFTTDLNEYTTLGGRGFLQEGVSCRIYNAPASSLFSAASPYFRIYDQSGKSHFWTTDRNEYLTLIRNRAVYLGESVDGFLLPNSQTGGTVPLYRLVARDASPTIHHWTVDVNEYNVLTAGPTWISEGIVGYVFP